MTSFLSNFVFQLAMIMTELVWPVMLMRTCDGIFNSPLIPLISSTMKLLVPELKLLILEHELLADSRKCILVPFLELGYRSGSSIIFIIFFKTSTRLWHDMMRGIHIILDFMFC